MCVYWKELLILKSIVDNIGVFVCVGLCVYVYRDTSTIINIVINIAILFTLD